MAPTGKKRGKDARRAHRELILAALRRRATVSRDRSKYRRKQKHPSSGAAFRVSR